MPIFVTPCILPSHTGFKNIFNLRLKSLLCQLLKKSSENGLKKNLISATYVLMKQIEPKDYVFIFQVSKLDHWDKVFIILMIYKDSRFIGKKCSLFEISFFSTLCYVKFIYSVKATKFCEIFPFLLTVCTVVKSKVKISQNFVAFSEYLNSLFQVKYDFEKFSVPG